MYIFVSYWRARGNRRAVSVAAGRGYGKTSRVHRGVDALS